MHSAELPRRSGTRAESIADDLRRDILTGQYAPGERLPTGASLSQRFGASMSVVREAISKLKHDGLIHSIQGAGMFVAAQSEARAFRLDAPADSMSALRRIFELRLAVEGEAVFLAAQRRTPEHLRALRLALAEMDTALNQDTDASAADARFHSLLALSTGNPLFHDLHAFLAAQIAHSIVAARVHSARHGLSQAAHEEHLAIFQAVEQQNAEAARRALRRHTSNALARLQHGALVTPTDTETASPS